MSRLVGDSCIGNQDVHRSEFVDCRIECFRNRGLGSQVTLRGEEARLLVRRGT